ncbi:MAG: hypothetical protein AAGM67_12930, partial [Bacteroidota bacterium]
MSTCVKEVALGYGEGEYGAMPYGSGDAFGAMFHVASINGSQFRVTYCEEMTNDAEIISIDNYTTTEILGVPVTLFTATVETLGPNGGVLSVIIDHSGTTLGGKYRMQILGPTDLSGNNIDLTKTEVEFLTYGDPPDYVITAVSGDQVDLDFDRPLLLETEFSPGVLELDAYRVDFTAPFTYPIPLVIETVTHPSAGLDDMVA